MGMFDKLINALANSSHEETEEEKKKRLARQALLGKLGNNPYKSRNAKIDQMIADAEK